MLEHSKNFGQLRVSYLLGRMEQTQGLTASRWGCNMSRLGLEEEQGW